MTMDAATAVTCPDCGGPLNLTIEGFRPATVDEQLRLTPEAIRVLGLCPDVGCSGRSRLPGQRSRT
jgi:hypothetical protein